MTECPGAYRVIHQHGSRWWFVDENGEYEIGAFRSEASAGRALAGYRASLNREAREDARRERRDDNDMRAWEYTPGGDR